MTRGNSVDFFDKNAFVAGIYSATIFLVNQFGVVPGCSVPVRHRAWSRVHVAWDETASLRREKSHATVIDARIEQLTSLVVDLSVKAPERRGRPPVPRHDRDESPVGQH